MITDLSDDVGVTSLTTRAFITAQTSLYILGQQHLRNRTATACFRLVSLGCTRAPARAPVDRCFSKVPLTTRTASTRTILVVEHCYSIEHLILSLTDEGPNSMRMAPTHNPPHSLQVGSHLPLQHRNSFCVSALSSTPGSSFYAAPQSYTASNHYATQDPFTFSAHRGPFEDLTSSEVKFFCLLAVRFQSFSRFPWHCSRSRADWAFREPDQLRWPTVDHSRMTPLKWI